MWPAQAELTASCNRLLTRLRRKVDHDIATVRCECGIHASNDVKTAANYLDLYSDVTQPHVRYRVVGLVSLWGSVVEGEQGWRASHAYPQRLFLPSTDRLGRPANVDAIRDRLSDYGIPIEIVEPAAEDTALARAVQRVRRDGRRHRVPTRSG